jgi:hypothetical protein
MRIKNLMQQNIASIASVHHFIRRRCISRNHNLPIAGRERVPIRLFPYPMLNRKRSNRNVCVAIHNSRPNLMYLDLVSSRVSLLQSPPPNLNVFRPGLLDVRSHILKPTRTISLQGFFSPQHPRRKNQIRIPQRVIRMQMSDKNNLQFLSLQSRNPIPFRRCRPSHHSRSAVDQISPIIHDHRHRRPPPIRVRTRIPRPQHDHACGRRALIVGQTTAGETIVRRPTRTTSKRHHYKKESRHSQFP